MQNRIKIELTPCRYCGSDNVTMVEGTFSAWVACNSCGITTRQFDSIQEAETFWNNAKGVDSEVREGDISGIQEEN